MRGKLGLVLVSVAVGVLVGGAVSSWAAVEPQTISLLEVDTSYAGVGGYDTLGSAPPSVGQGVTFGGTVYRWAGTARGAAVGHVQAVCTVTSAREAVCEGLVTLPAGTLVLVGPANLSGGASDIPVVGGSGGYVGAEGYMHSAPIGGQNSNQSADVIHLVG